MRRKVKVLSAFVSSALLLIAFNNCARSFEANDSMSLSSSCLSKVRTEASMISVTPQTCSDASAYECEKRIFSPDLENSDSLVTECGVEHSTCIQVRVLTFNTQVARTADNAIEFMPGGEYNRTEIQCSNHAVQFRGVDVLQAEGSNVFEALDRVIAQCNERSQR